MLIDLSALFSVSLPLRMPTWCPPFCPVQTALGLLRPRPAPRPRIVLRGDRPGLRLAPYALVALPQQRVDRHVVLLDVPPHLLGTPAGQRRYLGRRVPPLPADHPRARPLRRLLAPYPRHPRLVPLQSPLQRLYLLLHGELGPQHLQRQPIAPHHLLAELVGLLKEEARVYGKDGHLVGDLRDHVYEGHPLGPPEGGRERKPLSVGLDRPL